MQRNDKDIHTQKKSVRETEIELHELATSQKVP